MKIAILGGSFNPIHKGHIYIAQDAIKELKLDKLFFVPAYKSPFKKFQLEDPHHRVKMIAANLDKKMEISDFEIKQKGTSYTIETIRFFRNKYPQAKIYVLIGSDLVYKLNKWREIKEIVSLAQIAIFKRSKTLSHINLKKFNCIILNNELYPYSSSSFRHGDFSNVTKNVAQYIGENQLYVKEILSNMVNPTRYKHCLATAKFAAKLAKLNYYDINKAWITGVFHDITKNWDIKKHQIFLTRYDINSQLVPNYKLHSLTGSVWVNKVYGINDQDIINAIKNHTSLAPELSLLDKIVYAADKLCEGRKYAGIQKDRELIFSNFEKGFQNVVKKTYQHLATHRPLTAEQAKVYKEWANW